MATLVSLKGDDDALTIAWSDGVTHRLTWKLLREACPCATCRELREQRALAGASGQKKDTSAHSPSTGGGGSMTDLLPVLSLEETRPLRVSRMQPVGNYAYDIDFSDGHDTGIYTLDYLRELGEASANSPDDS